MPEQFKGFLDSPTAENRETRWLTPSWVVEPLGDFDLDPCGAPEHSLARVTYMPENGKDGLVEPWFGRVWCNPPYGRESVPFMKRLAEHGNGIALVFARTDTKMFHDYVFDCADALLFIKSRVSFIPGAGTTTKTDRSGAPSVLVAYGKENVRALEECGIAGKFIRL